MMDEWGSTKIRYPNWRQKFPRGSHFLVEKAKLEGKSEKQQASDTSPFSSLRQLVLTWHSLHVSIRPEY